MTDSHLPQAHRVYSPVATSSFVAPAVRRVAISCTSLQPAASGRVTSCSSKRTRPRAPGGLTGVHGTTCFCPLSAMAANHSPAFFRRRNSRMTGFSPFEAVT